jgi:hypothetical protein
MKMKTGAIRRGRDVPEGGVSFEYIELSSAEDVAAWLGLDRLEWKLDLINHVIKTEASLRKRAELSNNANARA